MGTLRAIRGVSSMDFTMTALGWFGGGLYLAAYLCLVKGWVAGTSYRFHGANMLSGTCLAISSAYFGAIPSMAINVVFVGIGLYYVVDKARGADPTRVVTIESARFPDAQPANRSLEAA